MRRELRAIVTASLFAGVPLGGCAAIQQSQAMDTERALAASGFQMKMADSPQKLAKLQALPQRKLFPQTIDGEVRYVYADATYCKCVYAGSEKSYQNYAKLEEQKEIAETNEMAAMDWGAWGPWGPWWY